MNIHILSRSKWNEPHRIRQQIAQLLGTCYAVQYHSPARREAMEASWQPAEIALKAFPFFEKFASLPVVSIFNSILLFLYLKRKIKPNDVLINFLPELLFVPHRRTVNLISVVNDDFSLMAPRVFAWWIERLMKMMTESSDASLYTSSRLAAKYPGRRSLIFHPWADASLIKRKKIKRKKILHWGYMSKALDFSKIECMAMQIQELSMDMEILLVGPVEKHAKRAIEKLASYGCVTYQPPTGLQFLKVEEILFGIELISPDFLNSTMLEMPNKGPRLLACGIPVVYSGCELVDEPFFIRFEGDLAATVKLVEDREELIDRAIDRYFLQNNSAARLKTLRELVSGG
jgi:hypothetical protein